MRYKDPAEAIAYLRSRGARLNKRQELEVKSPLTLRTLGALDYIQKTNWVVYSKEGATVLGQRVRPQREAA